MRVESRSSRADQTFNGSECALLIGLAERQAVEEEPG